MKIAVILGVAILFLVIITPVYATLFTQRTKLTGYYTFDEHTGTTIADISGNGHNATMSGSVHNAGLFSTGSYSLTCPAANANLGNVTRFDLTAAVTVSAWLNTAKIGITQYPLSAYTGEFSRLELYINSANYFKFAVGNGVTNNIAQSTTLAVAGEWAHVTGRWNGSHVDIFVNGTLENSVALSGTLTVGTSLLYAGQRSTGASPYNGTIEEIRIYNASLTNTEIAELYNYNPITPPPVSQNIDFSLSYITDIQNIADNHPTWIPDIFIWTANQAINYNTSALINTGDWVNNADHADEWNPINSSLNSLNGMPYAWAAGNHDNTSTGIFGGNTYTNLNVGLLKFKPYWIDSYNGGQNTAIQFTIKNYSFVVIGLEFNAETDGLTWAANIITEHSDSNIIILTHSFIDENEAYVDSWGEPFETWLSNYGNIILVLSGHVHGNTLETSTGFRQVGNRTEMMWERQDLNDGYGAFAVRTISVNLANNNATVLTWSNDTQTWIQNPENYYSFNLPMQELTVQLTTDEVNNNLFAIGLLAIGCSFTFGIIIVKRRNQ